MKEIESYGCSFDGCLRVTENPNTKGWVSDGKAHFCREHISLYYDAIKLHEEQAKERYRAVLEERERKAQERRDCEERYRACSWVKKQSSKAGSVRRSVDRKARWEEAMAKKEGYLKKVGKP